MNLERYDVRFAGIRLDARDGEVNAAILLGQLLEIADELRRDAQDWRDLALHFQRRLDKQQ